MPKYHAIIKDVQVYDFIVEVPEGMTEYELEDHVFTYLSENRDTCWRSGQEKITVLDSMEE